MFAKNRGVAVGDLAFLEDVTFCNHGTTARNAYPAPQRTNQSGEIRVHGWLGQTDNIDRVAIGVGAVVRLFENGRCRVRVLGGRLEHLALDVWADQNGHDASELAST